MPKYGLDYKEGDVVQWVPGRQPNWGKSPNGPFLVRRITDKGTAVYVSILGGDGRDMFIGGTCGFFGYRFRKDHFLSAVKKAHAKNKVRTR